MVSLVCLSKCCTVSKLVLRINMCSEWTSVWTSNPLFCVCHKKSDQSLLRLLIVSICDMSYARTSSGEGYVIFRHVSTLTFTYLHLFWPVQILHIICHSRIGSFPSSSVQQHSYVTSDLTHASSVSNQIYENKDECNDDQLEQCSNLYYFYFDLHKDPHENSLTLTMIVVHSTHNNKNHHLCHLLT